MPKFINFFAEFVNMVTEEQYIIAIDSLLKKNIVASTSDIARLLNIKPSSVSERLLVLQKKGYINYQKYKGVVLTKKGKDFVSKINFRTQMIYRFLKQIEVPDRIALTDAKTMEKYLSHSTLKQIQKFFEFLKLYSAFCFFEYFKQYNKDGKITKKIMSCPISSSFKSHPNIVKKLR